MCCGISIISVRKVAAAKTRGNTVVDGGLKHRLIWNDLCQ